MNETSQTHLLLSLLLNILQGVYEMKNKMKISIDPTVIPALPYGPYIGRGYMYENDELVGCIKYTADVVPKQTGKKRKQGWGQM